MDMQKAYEMCLAKTQKHMELHKGAYEYGGPAFDGNYEAECSQRELNNRYNWMISFVTGMGVLAYRTTKEKKYLDWLEKYEQAYYDKMFVHYDVNSIHDLGFIYSPYSVALYKETGKEIHKQSALRAADELVKRFDIDGRYIDAWCDLTKNPPFGRVIVDTMMNLPLLFWAWKETGHIIYKQVAKAHMETVEKYFIREDNTIAHAFEFERGTGKLLRECNSCGYSNGSYWARGTAWAIYGFAIAARYLEEDKYAQVSSRLLDEYLKHMPEGTCIPPWDFRLPADQPCYPSSADGIPENRKWDYSDPKNYKCVLDTSAAIVASLGATELCAMQPNEKYSAYVDGTIEEICRDHLSYDPSIQGLVMHQDGHNTYATWGDYYFFELLTKKMFNMPTCW